MRYTPDHKGTGRLLNSADVADMVMKVASEGEQYARSIAPKETGAYVRGFRVVPAQVKIKGESRPAARIENNASHAAAVEWGPGAHRVLGRTLEELRRRYDPKGY